MSDYIAHGRILIADVRVKDAIDANMLNSMLHSFSKVSEHPIKAGALVRIWFRGVTSSYTVNPLTSHEFPDITLAISPRDVGLILVNDAHITKLYKQRAANWRAQNARP